MEFMETIEGYRMKFWTIVEPGDNDVPIYTTLSEEQILMEYFDYWSGRMKSVGKHDEINPENCVYDWCVVHWAWETNAQGEVIEKNIVRGYN